MAPSFSIWVFLGLLAVLLASCAMFWAHVQRWTHNQRWVALGDWANRNRFKLRRAAQAHVPQFLRQTTSPPPIALVSVVGRRTIIMQIETPASDQAPAAPRRWNVLVRDIKVDWPPTALRPARHERSLIDLFHLSSFPALLSSERFTLHGIDSPAARAVVTSVLMGLLPQDLGMLLYGKRLVLDFSTRPFDGIELSRIAALAEQLVQRLPAKIPARKR